MAQKFTVPITVKQLSSAGSDAITLYVDTETYSRLKIEAGGRLTWGSGSANGDVNLYRDGADVLRTDDTFKTPTLFVDNIEIDTTGAQTDYILKFDGTKFTAASATFGSSGATTLDELTDVTISSSTPGDFLKWNGTAWVNDPIDLGTDTTGNYMSGVSAGTGISVTHTPGEGSTATIGLNATLDNLSNVTVPTPSTNDVLQYNGSAWVNTAASSVGATNLDGLTDVTITSATNGQILVYDGTNWVNTVRPSNEPMGFENAASSAISFDKTNRQFSISPVSGSFTVWVNGKRFVKTGTETITIENTSALYYIYYNSSGTLSSKTTFFTLSSEAPIAYVYWNQSDATHHFFADERHGITLDWATHEYLHRTRGAAIANGFGVNNYTTSGNGSLDSHAQLDIANGTFFDEDLKIDITHSATPAPNSHEQFLQGGAKLPVFYRTNTHYRRDTATSFPMKQGTARVTYNLLSGGLWSTPDIDNNKFGITYIVATNDLNAPIFAMMGQAQFTDQGSAEAASWNDMDVSDFPVAEFRILYKIIYQTSNAYSNTPHAKLTGIQDLRVSFISGGNLATAPVSDHGTLTGLLDDDHTQYLTDARHDVLDHTTAMSTVVLDDISNVSVATPTTGDVLKYNGSLWVNDPINLGTDTVGNYVSSITAGTGIAVNFTPSEDAGASVSLNATLDQLSDVNAPSPVSGDFLRWNGTAWINDAIDLATDTIGNYVSSITAGTGISVNFTPSENAGASVSLNATLDQLTDVSTSGAVANDVLKYNGSSWIAASAGGANVTSSATAPASPNAGDLWLDSVNVELFVYYDSQWVQLTNTEPVVEDLNDLADVDVPSPTVGNFLKYDGTYWISASIPSINALDDIGDVNVTGASNNQFLKYNGSTWIAASIPTINALDDIGDVSVAGATSGQFLKWNGSNWVADTIVGGATTSSGAPSSPTTGQIWFDTDDARTYVYYDSTWVEVGASGMAAVVSDSSPSSPISGQIWYKSDTGGTYIYYNSTWVEIGAAPAVSAGKAIAMSIIFGG